MKRLPTRGCGTMVAPQPSKLMTRVRFPPPAPLVHTWTYGNGPGSSGVEHILGKDEVAGSIPALGSRFDGFCVAMSVVVENKMVD